jgi:hypothetical protein
MIRSVLVIPFLLVPTALGAAPLQPARAVPATYGLSTVAARTRDDDRVCLVEKKTRHLICQTRGAWRRVARRLEAKAASEG